MSRHIPEHTDVTPRIELWLVIAAASLVPLALAVFMSGTLQIALWIAGGALLAGGLAMAAARRRGPEAPSVPASADRREEAA